MFLPGIGQNLFDHLTKPGPGPPTRRQFTGAQLPNIRHLPLDEVVSEELRTSHNGWRQGFCG